MKKTDPFKCGTKLTEREAQILADREIEIIPCQVEGCNEVTTLVSPDYDDWGFFPDAPDGQGNLAYCPKHKG